jgi:hypothetical protein
MAERRGTDLVRWLAPATGAAVVFAAWNVWRAVMPAAPPGVTAVPPATPASTGPASAPAGAPPAGTAVSGTPAPAQASPTAPPHPDGRLQAEATLAPAADPFRPLPRAPVAPSAANLGPGQNGGSVTIYPPPGGTRDGSAGQSALPSGQFSGNDSRAPSLPPVGGSASDQSGPGSSAPRSEAPPPLVGTLMGSTPSAAFRVGKDLQLAAPGDRVGAWQVLSVTHGEAVVRGPDGVRRLRLGGDTGGADRPAR